jgi:dTDP-glucose 4,6-dehydratase
MASTTTQPTSVVTGGAGFLGSHLTDLLLSRGHRVICLDNLITGNLDNIAHLRSRTDYEFIHHNVTEYIDIPGKVDYIWHFASPASPIDYLELPIQTLKVGAMGTHKALGLARAKGPLAAGFHLRVSTATRSSTPSRRLLGQREPHRPARRVRRGQALRRGHDHGLPPLSRRGDPHRPHLQHLRPAHASQGRPRGAGLHRPRPSRASPSPCSATANRRAASATSPTSSRASTRLMMSDYAEPVNIGNPREMTVLDFAHEIQRLCGSTVPIVHKPLPVDDPKVRQPNIGPLITSNPCWSPENSRSTLLPLPCVCAIPNLTAPRWNSI